MRSTLPVFLLTFILTGILSFGGYAKSPTPVNAVPDDVEFAALKAIYDNLGGTNWTTKTNWPASGSWPTSATSAQFGTWYGVTVTNGDITKIALPNNKLIGTIPSEIGSLQALNTLNLYNNRGITGSIPATIGQVSALQYVYLYTCSLTGAIPSSLFDISGLQWVNVGDNKLSGSIPSNIGNATALTYIGFHANDLTGTIPSGICNLVNLGSLYLYENALTGNIPSNIGNLTKLVNFVAYTNQLTGDIPSSLWSINTLVDLRLSSNQLSGELPASIGNLSNLQTFSVHTNKMSGSIPSEIGSLSKLVNLYLYNNQFTGNIPSSLGNLVNLVYFQLHNNKLSGSLPASLANLTKVKYFYVNDNQLTGNIPAGFSALNQMVTFYIYNNRFSGELPAAVFNGWNKVTAMNISNNQFSGAFPSSISSCVALASINGLKNQFTSLPSELLSLPVFNSTNFSYNALTSLPDFTTHVNKANLYLNVSYNRLDFGTLQPLVGAGFRSLVLTPQKNIQDVLFVTPAIGATLTIPGRSAGSNGTIFWERQQEVGNWSDETSKNEGSAPTSYMRNAFAASDEGIYRIRMTNTSFAGVTIVSEPIKVKTAINLAIDNWGFQYRYDGRRRMTHKKVPGADWVYMVYDERDRLVMTQDGEQRKNNQWLVTKYDALNRPIITAIYEHTAAIDQGAMADLISTTSLYDSFDGTTTFHGYSNTVFPTDVTKLNVLTVTYYDSYDYKNVINDDRYNYKSDELANQYKYDAAGNSFTGVIGQVTGTKSKVLGQGNYIITASYYDDKYRMVQTVSNDMHGSTDRVTNIYDFVGKIKESKTTHTDYAVTWTNVVSPASVNTLNNILTRAGADGWIAGASSKEILPAGQDGWMEVTVSETNRNRMVGLASSDPDAGIGSINYAWYMVNSSFSMRLFESGTQRYQAAGLTTGDVLRIERKGTTIIYRYNGRKITPTVASAQSNGDLRVDASMFTPGATLLDVRASFAAKSTSITRTFDYDHAGRLRKVWHQVNATPRVLLVENEYNELGQLITKKLHSENEGTSFKQHVDMRYNIRGWLTRINNADLTPDESSDPRDHFGMNLAYNETVSTLNNTPQFNGNISAMRWSNSQGFDDVKESAYAYNYDAMNRIAGAGFRQKQSSGWGLPQHKDADDNTVTSEAFTEAGYKYDLNGNLQELARKGKDGISMDVLSYDYGTGAAKSNKLLSVSDAGDIRQGFADGNIGSEDYTYDNNGSMVADKNKDISTITYNHLNLPVQVTKVSGEYIKYFYDAMGRKLCQQVYTSASVLTKQSDYAGELFYENDTLKFINHEEGRVVMTGTTPEYQYHLKDHLGNVRVTFTAKVEVESPVATMETANEGTERNDFLYYDEAVKVNFELFDHTNAGTTYYSTRLNGTANERTGLAKSLSVMPGDVIKAHVYAKYLDTNTANWSSAVTNLITSIANGTAATGVYRDGGAIGSTGGSINPFAGILDKGNETGTAPKAYLNYLVFDRDYNVVEGGFVRITEAAKESGTDRPHELLSKELLIKKPGYVYIYLSNDNMALGGSSVEVYFDDFNVEYTKSPVIASQEYYPFGLTFNNYQRENSLKNQYLYNKGAERQDELDLNVDATKYRVYDPATDRWWQVDPLADEGDLVSLTPYNYSFNNPIRYNDPDGDCPCLAVPIAIGMAILEGAVIFTAAKTVEAGVKAYGKDVLKAMGNATPYSTPGVDAAQSLGGVKSLNSSGKSENQSGESSAKPSGSYTNKHESGKRYHGKGGEDRAKKSADRVAKQEEDPAVEIDWKPAKNDREAFKDEAERISKDGGIENPFNYNKINSPGKKYIDQDKQKQNSSTQQTSTDKKQADTNANKPRTN